MAGYRQTGGLAAVSAEEGKRLFARTVVHDDGVIGYGGTRTMVIGDLGTGKTTLALLATTMSVHIKNVKKDVWFEDPKCDVPEADTVIWRGRKLDYWNLFTRKNYSKSFPNLPYKPLRVHVFHKDDIEFLEDFNGKPSPIEDLDVMKYTDIQSLYNNLVVSGINVIYAPKVYFMSEMLKKTLNEVQLLNEDDKRYIPPDQPRHATNFLFWYDLIYFMIELDKHWKDLSESNRRIRWITLILDEAAQIFPDSARAELWHLVNRFAEHELIETRRINLSIFALAHESAFIFWKIFHRFNTIVWLPRSSPTKRISKISDKLIQKLPLGWGIIEEKGGRFGKMHFNEIPHQPRVLTALGYE